MSNHYKEFNVCSLLKVIYVQQFLKLSSYQLEAGNPLILVTKLDSLHQYNAASLDGLVTYYSISTALGYMKKH
jgi:hypothetical protein